MAIDLPKTFKWIDFEGTQKEYLDKLYEIFKHDFYINHVTFNGQRVLPQKYPVTDERPYTFNHITKFRHHNSNSLDYNRSKKIPLIATILNGCNDKTVKCWEFQATHNKRRVTRIKVWYERSNILIILQPKDDKYILITAYTISQPYKINKVKREYKSSVKVCE